MKSNAFARCPWAYNAVINVRRCVLVGSDLRREDISWKALRIEKGRRSPRPFKVLLNAALRLVSRLLVWSARNET